MALMTGLEVALHVASKTLMAGMMGKICVKGVLNAYNGCGFFDPLSKETLKKVQNRAFFGFAGAVAILALYRIYRVYKIYGSLNSDVRANADLESVAKEIAAQVLALLEAKKAISAVKVVQTVSGT